MTKIRTALLCILICTAATGCSRNAPSATDHTNAASLTSMKDSADPENSLYSILGLSIGCSEDDVTALYGEPDSRYYEVTDQSLHTHMIYHDKTIVARDFLDQSEKYDGQNGVVEIEMRNGKFETSQGIKIGDSAQKIKKQYHNVRIYSYGEKDDLVASLIFNRAEKKDTYKNRDYPYEYGKIDQVAYVLSQKKYNDHCNIPALIFLLYKNKVTRIIVMNTIQ